MIEILSSSATVGFGFTGGEGYIGPIFVIMEVVEVRALFRFMLVGGHRHRTD